jgi:hypothetical protein
MRGVVVILIALLLLPGSVYARSERQYVCHTRKATDALRVTYWQLRLCQEFEVDVDNNTIHPIGDPTIHWLPTFILRYMWDAKDCTARTHGPMSDGRYQVYGQCEITHHARWGLLIPIPLWTQTVPVGFEVGVRYTDYLYPTYWRPRASGEYPLPME